MLNRLEEIKEMDKLFKIFRKKELRKEVREIKSELKRSGQGVYFSVGANNHYSFINFITIKNSIPFKRKEA
jgi:diaminopimelate decarboxylase